MGESSLEYLTSHALNHRLNLFSCIVRPTAPAEVTVKILTALRMNIENTKIAFERFYLAIGVLRIFRFLRLVKSAGMLKAVCRTIAAEVPLWEQLYLFMVCVACDTAR